MNLHTPIQAPDAYNEALSQSLADKLFFVEKVKFDLVVDFGCGDGTILKELTTADWCRKAVGIERDPTQAAAALSNLEATKVYREFDSGLQRMVTNYPGKTLALLSSVLHESPHLLTTAVLAGFDYIVVRDMALLAQHRHRKSYLEALLKAPYLTGPDAARELGEDYFCLPGELTTAIIPGYSVVYSEHYTLPYVQDSVERALGSRLEVPTHIKVIFKKD